MLGKWHARRDGNTTATRAKTAPTTSCSGNCVFLATVIVLSNDVGELCTIRTMKKNTEKNLFRTVHYLFSKMCDLSRTTTKKKTKKHSSTVSRAIV